MTFINFHSFMRTFLHVLDEPEYLAFAALSLGKQNLRCASGVAHNGRNRSHACAWWRGYSKFTHLKNPI